MKKCILHFVLFLVCFLGVWILLDWIGSVWIFHGKFEFSPFSDLTTPLLLGSALGYFLILRKELKQ